MDFPMKLRVVCVLGAVCLLLAGMCGCAAKAPEVTLLETGTNAEGNRNPLVVMQVKDFGTIQMELYPDKAPNTVNSFISLINKGFYNGVVFHRVAPGFVIQGGDPEGTGRGGPGYSITGEFPVNGFTQNDLLHVTGALSMARSQSLDSGGSQFFICLDDLPGLDGLGYCVFGQVIGEDSLAVVKQIAATKLSASETPAKPPVMDKVTVDTFGVTYPEPEVIK